jgi:hypothetical protein
LSVPTALGFFRPAVVIPSWLMQELPARELNQVLLHELAHLQRWDDWTNLIQKTLRAMLFFHPAAWWIERELSLQRENACDDFVLSETEDPKSYARCLALLAEKSFVRRGMALAQAAVTRFRQTSLRVSRILQITSPGTTRLGKPAVSLVAAFSFACLVGQSYAPKLLVFQDSNAAAVAASLGSKPAGREIADIQQPSTDRPQIAKSQPARLTHRSLAPTRTVVQAPPPRRTFAQSAEPAVAYEADEGKHPPKQSLDGAPDPAGLILAKAPARPTHRTAAREAFLVVIEGQEDRTADLASWRVTVWRVVICPGGASPAYPDSVPPRKIT